MVLITLRKQCVGSREVEMAPSADDLETSLSIFLKSIPKLGNARCDDRLFLVDHPKFELQEVGLSRRAWLEMCGCPWVHMYQP